MSTDKDLARALLSASAVRARAAIIHKAGLEGRLSHFALHPERLPDVAAYVVETIRLNYPTLDIPFHARWRHFAIPGRDLWAEAADARTWKSPADRGRAAYDLAICSVLLDAGAGADWRYVDDATGLTFARSEGLGIASLRMFEAGAFSSDPGDRLRADAARLAILTAEDIARGFQVSSDNPLLGVEGRVALLNALGRTAMAHPSSFAMADGPRPGGLFDLLTTAATDGNVPAPAILSTLLVNLGPIWPGRLSLGGLPLGDCWKHPLIVTDDATNGLIPFHKLSQWMAYSLIEPLQHAGFTVTDIDGLTGLPEYRNGGLILDAGLVSLKDPAAAIAEHAPDSELIVEWRALTVSCLDLIAGEVRRLLGRDALSLPLARVLEGGTWSAGRRIAREKRPGGGPPLSIVSDGTVF
jgi:Protein of unknown function (DUF1688)